MTSAKKKGGLGAESYFENIPTLEPAEEEEVPSSVEGSEKPVQETSKAKPEAAEAEAETAESQGDTEPPRQKIRRTYALYEETQIALEEMKLAARKQGVPTTLGDLLEEAVQLLMEKKGTSTQGTPGD